MQARSCTIVAAGWAEARQEAVLNDWMLQWGAAGWKPVLTALLLPPVPLLLLMLVGAGLLKRRPLAGWLLLLAGAAGIWLSSTTAVGQWLQRQLLQPPRALSLEQLQQLQARRSPNSAIVVLGGGRESYAPEFGAPNLSTYSMARLRYGLWLARETGLPVAFSGGSGRAQVEGPAEADVAARIAASEFGRPLKWTEAASRDTRDSAERSVALLRSAGVTRIVLVTHGWHMPRSLRAFEQAIASSGGGIMLTAAPMALARIELQAPLPWLPSQAGFTDTRHALREYLGLLAGA
jgi:uncharacterized SAM-binding protein YcdF (DUF218 family)